MKSKIFISIFTLIASIILTSSVVGLRNNNVVSNKQENIIENNKKDADSDSITITMRDIADFLETKKEHYPLSDEFVEKYQQSSGGYIDNAKKAGLVVDKLLHEPNQKWHFFDSWLYPSIEEGTLSWDDSAQSRVYTKLQCPELLLWIYEACEVDPSKVKLAKDKAEEGEVQGLATASIAKNMRSIVSWDDIKDTIIAYMNSDLQKYSVSVNSSEDFIVSGLANEYLENRNVEFSINVTNILKEIDKVTANEKTLDSISLNTYKFIMPGEKVNIVITLKDKNSADYIATSVTLNSTNISLNVGGRDKTLIASVLPIDTMDEPVWSIVEGNDVISISSTLNECVVHPIKEGIAKIKISYNSNVNAECIVTVKEMSNESYVTTYNVVSNTNKFDSKDDLFAALVKDGEGDGIISSISDMNEYVYGKASGGRGETAWSSSNLIKISSTSQIGAITFDLNAEVVGVKITGYIHNESLKFRVGDSSSLDWSDSQTDNKTVLAQKTNMTVVSKDAIASSNTSTIELKFEKTSSVKIATTNKYPLYITSLEFIIE